MFAEMFIRAALGHLVGDYMLQGRKAALEKSKKGLPGFAWCTLHSLIYTASVCLFLWTLNPLIIILVFFSHWPIDRWSLASWWLKLIGGRDFMDAYKSKEEYWEIDLSFSCLVYTIVDNTMHILLLFAIVKWLI